MNINNVGQIYVKRHFKFEQMNHLVCIFSAMQSLWQLHGQPRHCSSGQWSRVHAMWTCLEMWWTNSLAGAWRSAAISDLDVNWPVPAGQVPPPHYGLTTLMTWSLSAIMLRYMTSFAAKYDIYSPLPSTPVFEITLHIWKSFEKTAVNWSIYHGFICCVICFMVSNFCVF